LHKLFKVEGKTSEYNNSSFNFIVHKKLKITKEALMENKIVFCSDLDIVFLRNPLPRMTELIKTYDIIFQSDYSGEGDSIKQWGYKKRNPQICTGFFMVKPSPLTIDLFDPENYTLKSKNVKCDQAYINEKLRLVPKYEKLKIKVLSLDYFPTGSYWYNFHKRKIKPFVIHFNWLRSFKQKINKMKLEKLWII